MAIKDSIQESIDKLKEQLNQAVWFQEAKSKWEELEPAHQFYIKLGFISSGLLMVLILFVSNLLSVSNLKQEYADKLELVETLRQANDELRVLNAKTSAIGGAGSQKPNWLEVFNSVATNAGIPNTSVAVVEAARSKENTPLQEIIYKVDLSKVNVRQVVRFAYALEHETHPMKLKNITIDTEGGEGYLKTNLLVSVFQSKEEK